MINSEFILKFLLLNPKGFDCNGKDNFLLFIEGIKFTLLDKLKKLLFSEFRFKFGLKLLLLIELFTLFLLEKLKFFSFFFVSNLSFLSDLESSFL